ncbi:MAG: Thymidine kinase [bacterium ADurb.Bin400]|nr:MAG: Thymidine kinase [bacterium ADurb.Bin400]
MELILILGPMKSGKSFDLISYFAPLKYTGIPHTLFQSSRNVRDAHIWSRNGLELSANKVGSLSHIDPDKYKIVGIDEIHMFSESDVTWIDKLLRNGVRVVVSGLDLDYRGQMFPVIKRLFELGPTEVRYRRAVCEVCRTPDARYTQVLHHKAALLDGAPACLPDDGTYEYVPVCRACFVKKTS